MKKNLFLKQLEYELWANKMSIKAISDADKPEERVQEILSHLLISPSNWLKRIKNEPATLNAWNKLSLDDCMSLAQDNYDKWTEFISNISEEELKAYIVFPFMGNSSKISIEDLFTHLINHSSYHRGQIITKLKGKLNPLPLTTYIAFATIKE
jgi:uncharacterized damage-inducible protein DinB